jgi:hypothetical protein
MRRKAGVAALVAALMLVGCGTSSPGSQCASMLPDGVSTTTTTEGPFVCIQVPEPLTGVGPLVTVGGYAAGADEVVVELRGVDTLQNRDVVLASLRAPVEGRSPLQTGEAALGTWSAQLPLLPEAGVGRRATIVAELRDDASGRAAASAEIAITLDVRI